MVPHQKQRQFRRELGMTGLGWTGMALVVRQAQMVLVVRQVQTALAQTELAQSRLGRKELAQKELGRSKLGLLKKVPGRHQMGSRLVRIQMGRLPEQTKPHLRKRTQLGKMLGMLLASLLGSR